MPVNLRPVDTVQIESTDLCLAFAVDDTYNNSLQKQRQPKMDVFAYLPLRSFGFSFIIQADFVVPASRQDVTQDSDWNQWIIKQIPNLFVSAFHTFRTHPDFKDEISALIAYMRFVPLEQEVVGCFQSVPRQINELLRNEEFLPVIASSEENDDGDIVWKKPFECVLIQGMLKKHPMKGAVHIKDIIYSCRFFFIKMKNKLIKMDLIGSGFRVRIK